MMWCDETSRYTSKQIGNPTYSWGVWVSTCLKLWYGPVPVPVCSMARVRGVYQVPSFNSPRPPFPKYTEPFSSWLISMIHTPWKWNMVTAWCRHTPHIFLSLPHPHVQKYPQSQGHRGGMGKMQLVICAYTKLYSFQCSRIPPHIKGVGRSLWFVHKQKINWSTVTMQAMTAPAVHSPKPWLVSTVVGLSALLQLRSTVSTADNEQLKKEWLHPPPPRQMLIKSLRETECSQMRFVNKCD